MTPEQEVEKIISDIDLEKQKKEKLRSKIKEANELIKEAYFMARDVGANLYYEESWKAEMLDPTMEDVRVPPSIYATITNTEVF